MANTNFRGPVAAMGSLENAVSNTTTITVTTANQANPVVTNVEPQDGASLFYQGTGWPDLRSVPYNKDATIAAAVPAFMTLTDGFSIDNFPQAAGTALVALLQTTSGASMTLVTAQQQNTIPGQAFIAAGVPIIPAGTTVATTVPIALDFGFTTGTTVANSSTVTVLDNTQFTLGQWIVVGGAGNTAGTQSLIAQVTSIASTNITGITISPAAATGVTNAPIGQANLFDSGDLPVGGGFGPSPPTANSHTPRLQGGIGRWFNPREGLARNVVVWAGTTSATSAYTVSGYDIWGNPMTEKLTVPSLANRGAAGSTFFGQKAFKYIQSAAISTASAGSTAIGIGDVFGFPVRADAFSQVEVYWNNWAVPQAQGFTAAYTTAPSTNTTGDVRGTIQVSTNGTGSAVAIGTAQVSNGTTRLTVIQNLSVWQTVYGTPNNTVPVFGINQA